MKEPHQGCNVCTGCKHFSRCFSPSVHRIVGHQFGSGWNKSDIYITCLIQSSRASAKLWAPLRDILMDLKVSFHYQHTTYWRTCSDWTQYELELLGGSRLENQTQLWIVADFLWSQWPNSWNHHGSAFHRCGTSKPRIHHTQCVSGRKPSFDHLISGDIWSQTEETHRPLWLGTDSRGLHTSHPVSVPA